MPANAADVVRSAFLHTIQQLFKPFRLGQWTRLAVTGLLAGELSSTGGCSFRLPAFPQNTNSSEHFLAQGLLPMNMLLFAGVALLIMLGMVLLVLLSSFFSLHSWSLHSLSLSSPRISSCRKWLSKTLASRRDGAVCGRC